MRARARVKASVAEGLVVELLDMVGMCDAMLRTMNQENCMMHESIELRR